MARSVTKAAASHFNLQLHMFRKATCQRYARRRMGRSLGLLIAVLVSMPGRDSAFAQAQGVSSPISSSVMPLKGIVWSEPTDQNTAVADLLRFHAAGVEAVRTDVLKDTSLYAIGDTLGIQFFQDLPFDRYSAAELIDGLDSASAQLDKALLQSANHRSARHFGLARSSDTSVKSSCRYFETLALQVQARIRGAESYYVSGFLEDDACALTVDFVLLDRYAADRVVLDSRTRQLENGPARAYGIGELGLRVDAHDRLGLNQPHSEESQARYLESSLTAMLHPSDQYQNLKAVFVYRYRPDPDAPQFKGYALDLGAETHRPGWNVVRGIYTGSQTVFAFPAGPSRSSEMPWLAVVGLIVVAVLAVSHTASPQFRQLGPRYFLAHGFYREAAAAGREVTPVINGALLVAISLSIGSIVAVVFHTVRYLPAVETMLYWLPRGVSRPISVLGQRPWLLALLVACASAVLTFVWIAVMSLLSRFGRSLVPAQTLMLALWPQWVLIALLPVALVTPTFPAPVAESIAYFLTAASSVAFLWILLRTATDYGSTSRSPAWALVLVVIANPIVFASIALAAFLLPQLSRIRFLIHLAVRS